MILSEHMSRSDCIIMAQKRMSYFFEKLTILRGKGNFKQLSRRYEASIKIFFEEIPQGLGARALEVLYDEFDKAEVFVIESRNPARCKDLIIRILHNANIIFRSCNFRSDTSN